MYDDSDMEDDNMRNTFHRKVTRMEEENAILREEIAKLDERNSVLEKQYAYLKRQLEQIHEKYNELQRECDKQKTILDEVIMREKMVNVDLKRSIKERQDLSAKLEAAELEAQEAASLKEKLKKVTSGKFEYTKKIADVITELNEKHSECESLRQTIKELEEINECLRTNYEIRENTIQVLREKNREFMDENAELKSLIDINVRLSTDRLSTTSNSEAESFRMHSTLDESNGAILQDSLYDELRKASVFTNTYDKDDTINCQLKDQIHWYKLEIGTLLERTESVFKQLESIYGEERFRPCITQNLEYTECSENTQDFETLKQRIQILLDMIIETSSKSADNNIEIGIQVRADSRTIQDLREFSVPNFYEYLSFQQSKVFAPCDISDNKQDPFLSVKLPKKKIVSESSIIDPIIEALDKIVLHTASIRTSPRKKDSMESSSLSKCRSIHTLTFHQNSHKETTHARSDILHGDGDFPLKMEPAIIRESSRFIAKGKDSKRTNKGANVDPRNATIPGYRRSKSETSLVAEKKLSSFCSSLNVAILSPKKRHEVVGIRKSLNDLTLKDRKGQRIIEKSNHSNLQSVEELRDMIDQMEKSLEENNNVLQATDVYTPASAKLDNILNDISQNCKQELADPSRVDIVGEEERLRTPVSHIRHISRIRQFVNILIVPSWRLFITYVLVFTLGFYIKNVILSTSICTESPCKWWSFEEILDRYIHIRHRGRPPPV